ncbi:hypothetical protein L3Q82_000649 [Scortum barcoo]|uniref:Uncharacterized protein n=1 Tax=Scortum barcoo TaxID=214431 RepID=A0ACB8WIJ6_9TELE|nr:hypothetical protein L3Q82_000649 [Scortum barcoo]
MRQAGLHGESEEQSARGWARKKPQRKLQRRIQRPTKAVPGTGEPLQGPGAKILEVPRGPEREVSAGMTLQLTDRKEDLVTLISNMSQEQQSLFRWRVKHQRLQRAVIPLQEKPEIQLDKGVQDQAAEAQHGLKDTLQLLQVHHREDPDWLHHCLASSQMGTTETTEGLIQDFVDWCLLEPPPDQHPVKPRRTMVVDFRRRSHSPPALVNIQGTDINTVKSFKYLGVHLNDSLDWSDNTNALVKKQTVPAQEAEVFWSAGTTPQDLL